MTESTSLVTEGVAPATDPAAGTPAATPPAGDTAATPAPGGAAQDATAKKPEDGNADEGKPSGAPEKYEDFKLPDGFQVDQSVMEEATSLFKEAGLSQDQAQKLVDMWTGRQRAMQEETTKAWEDLRAGWVKEARADKEFGGQKFDASLGKAKTALKTFGTPKLYEALEFSGMGDHPEFIRFLVKVGEAVGEDKLHIGNAGQPALDPAKVLFPSMN